MLFRIRSIVWRPVCIWRLTGCRCSWSRPCLIVDIKLKAHCFLVFFCFLFFFLVPKWFSYVIQSELIFTSFNWRMWLTFSFLKETKSDKCSPNVKKGVHWQLVFNSTISILIPCLQIATWCLSCNLRKKEITW